MALTRNFKQTVIERVNRDPAFAQALLDEAATLFLNGEPETARLILRDLVNATIGYFAVRIAWSIYLRMAWRQRRQRRQGASI